MIEVVLDTETTGLSVANGHRIVEIGCIELKNQIPTNKTFHCYLNPQRKVSEDALKVHGYSDEFLADKKKFSDVVSKYAVKAISYSSNIIKRKYYYKVKLKIVLSESAGYEATGKAKLPYDALNLAILHLSKILRRHYRKIKNENKGNKQIRLLKDSFLLYNLR